MECVSFDVHGVEFLVCDFDALGIVAVVELGVVSMDAEGWLALGVRRFAG